MRNYIASNYGMGRAVATIRFEARNNTEAQRIAESRLKGAYGLPGTGPGAAAKSRVLGIKYA